MSLSPESVLSALENVLEPDVNRSLIELNLVKDVAVNAENNSVTLTLGLLTPFPSKKNVIEQAVTAALQPIGASRVAIAWEMSIPTRDIQADDPCPGVRNIILVMSGKGGVGKSTVATNITLALSRTGMRVGLLDADMYGPSIPTMLGVMGRPSSRDGQRFLPLERFGVKLMSLGFLLEDEKQAVIWRGPMLQTALLQFLKDVEWGDLDYLILDMPPGTGDIALTLSQKIRTTGGIIVTTPQEVALQDVYKSVAMAQKVGIPLLGVVENESVFICDSCGKKHELFGSGGGARVAEFAAAPLLGQIPLDPLVRQWGDAGTPVVQAAPDGLIAAAFIRVAEQLAVRATAHNLSRPGTLRIDRSGGKNRHLPIAR